MVLTGSNTYTGPTTISAGTLQLGDGNGHDGSLAAAGGITDNAALVYNLSGSRTYSGVIGGTGSLTKLGTNVLVFTGSNGYNGPTTITSGTLQIGTGASGYDGSLASSVTITNTAALVYDLSGSQTFSGNLSGAGSLTKTGNGTLILSGVNNAGKTIVSAGTLEAAIPASLPHASGTSTLTVNGGAMVALSVGGTGWQSSDVSNLPTSGFQSGSVLGFDTTNANLTYTGSLAGSMGLTKLGPNTLTLTGNDSYTGSTTVNMGTLAVTSTSALQSYSNTSALTVNGGGTLMLSVGTTSWTGPTSTTCFPPRGRAFRPAPPWDWTPRRPASPMEAR